MTKKRPSTPDDAGLPTIRLVGEKQADDTEKTIFDSIEAETGLVSTIGPYKIKGILGEGGMGRVYRAEQAEPIRREVALKVSRTNLADPEAMARFSGERRALARLSHPGIAQMFEAGTTEEGHPYFVMELVDGVPITEFCDGNGLDLRSRLKLFLLVCEGVEHAHRKGILHRDLKPSNVLVADVHGRRVPKVIDFGIAKATDQSILDDSQMTGNRLLGTPAYLAPEAVTKADDADTQTDVYSLGIMLYELVAGTRPFVLTGESYVVALNRIVQEEPQRPSVKFANLSVDLRGEIAEDRDVDPTVLARQLSEDLDWIVLKAIEKDRTKRYGSPEALAADVGRFLDSEPIEARPPSRAYRFRKMVRRHRAASVATVLATIAVVLGGVGTTNGLLRAKEAEALALEEAMRANESAAAAERTTEFLVELFRPHDPDEPGHTRDELTAREMLDRGADWLRTSGETQPELRARMMNTLGRTYLMLGAEIEAESLLREALQVRLNTLAPDDPAVAESFDSLGLMFASTGQYETAERLYRQAFDWRREALGSSATATIESQGRLGQVILDQGDLERAEPLLEVALDETRRVLGDDDPRVDELLADQVVVAVAKGEATRAVELAGVLVDRARRREDDELGLAFALQRLAEAQLAADDVQRAAETISESIDLYEGRVADDDWRLAMAESVRAAGLAERGRYRDAERILEASLPLVRTGTNDRSPETRAVVETLAGLYDSWGRPAEAERTRQLIADVDDAGEPGLPVEPIEASPTSDAVPTGE